MAQTLPTLTGDLKQISECWLYRDPRVSHRARLHTFCRECKDTSTITKNDSCPLCRPFFRIPDDGCKSIPRNYFMEKLVDLHEAHLEKELKLKGEKIIGRISSSHKHTASVGKRVIWWHFHAIIWETKVHVTNL